MGASKDSRRSAAVRAKQISDNRFLGFAMRKRKKPRRKPPK